MIHLITGGNGFIGSHLIDHLLQERPTDSVHTLDRERAKHPKAQGHYCDLRDGERVKKVLADVKPDRVYHLAGFARVTADLGIPENFENNTLATVELLSAAATLKKKVAFFLASTSHVYGNQSCPVSEESLTLPATPYGFSKMLAEQAGRQTVEKNPSLQMVVGRLNNCIGPGQGPGFVVADLARKLHLTLASGGNQLETGPLNSRRSFMDVRDLVKLLPLLLDTPQPSRYEVYNLASSEIHTIREVVENLIQLTGKSITLKVKEDTANNAFAGLEIKTDKLARLLHPSFRSLQETLKDTLENELRGSVS